MHCLLTNPAPRNELLAALARTAGLSVTQRPLHDIVFAADAVHNLRSTLTLSPTAWLCCTSVTAVAALKNLWGTLPATVCIAAVGQHTAHALQNAGVAPQLIAMHNSAELGKLLAAKIPPGTVVFTAGAADGQTAWHNNLRAAGAEVTPIITHRLEAMPYDPATWLDHTEPLDAVLFTAPSAVRRFLQLCPIPGNHPALKHAHYFAIGTTTAAAMTPHLPLAGMPNVPDFSELIACVESLRT